MSEAFIFVVDNSEWMRNGDYIPSRMDAQRDAVLLLVDTKLNNAESVTAIVSSAGPAPKVHVALTNDLGQIRNAIDAVNIDGSIHLCQSLNVAQLALKNRLNKQQKQRIVVFIGSPIQDESEELVKLARKLKKNNCAVDVISFGEIQENQPKLDAFISALGTNTQNHLEVLPAGDGQIMSSWVLSGSIGGGADQYASLEETDPELAMALRLSLAESQGPSAQSTSATGSGEPSQGQDPAQAQGQSGQAQQMDVDDQGGSEFPANWNSMTEEEQVEYALRLSMEEDSKNQNQSKE
eukprot:ANDGO_02714.mRNA.1 26S proteasome non-ATPase regulatory subunit 4